VTPAALVGKGVTKTAAREEAKKLELKAKSMDSSPNN